jgi:hypothetical protein
MFIRRRVIGAIVVCGSWGYVFKLRLLYSDESFQLNKGHTLQILIEKL